MQVEIAPELRARIAADLHATAVAYPRRSLASQIRAEHFNDVVDAVALDIDLGIQDFETALILSLARQKAVAPVWFSRRAMISNEKAVTWKNGTFG